MKLALASLLVINAVIAVHGRAIPETQPEAIWDRLVGRFTDGFEASLDGAHHLHDKTVFPGLNPTGTQGIVPGYGVTGKPTGTGTGKPVPTGTGTGIVPGTGTGVYGTGTGITIGTNTKFSIFPTGTGIIRPTTTTSSPSQKPTTTTQKPPQLPTKYQSSAIDPAILPPSPQCTGTTPIAEVITSTRTVTQSPVTITQPPVTVTVAPGQSAPGTITVTPPAVTVTAVDECISSVVVSTVTTTMSVTVTAPVVTVTAVGEGYEDNSQTY